MKASEDTNYRWEEQETNIYHFRPGRTITHLFGDVVDLDQDLQLKQTMVAFVYAISYLMQAILRQDEALQVKYSISAKTLLFKQVSWLMEGLGRELENMGYQTSETTFSLSL